MQIQPEKDKLWDMLESLNNQLVQIQTDIGGLEFQQFGLNMKFAAEDEEAAQADAERQRGWATEADETAKALRAEMAKLVDAQTGQPTQQNAQEYNNLKQQAEAAEKQFADISKDVAKFEDDLKKRKAEQEQFLKDR